MGKERGILIAGNWKMNHAAGETSAFFSALDQQGGKPDPATKAGLKSGKLGALIFPPMLSLARARELAGKCALPVEIGAQNVHWEKKGAFTGEVSGPMIAELGLRWALTGHSERRQYFGETDETVRRRTESLLEQGFQVMMCIGETLVERKAGETQAVLTRQLSAAFPKSGAGASAYLDGRLCIAYEPVWAIGTGLTATPEQAQEAQAVVRGWLREHLGADAAEHTPILYGGSVTPDNVDQLLACPDVDGALVGGASLKPEGFLALLAAGGRALAK